MNSGSFRKETAQVCTRIFEDAEPVRDLGDIQCLRTRWVDAVDQYYDIVNPDLCILASCLIDNSISQQIMHLQVSHVVP